MLYLLLSFLIGSFPTAYLAGKYFHGVDIREHGSKNPGATNAIRVLGWKTGLAVLVLDIFKGTLGVLLPLHFLSQGYFRELPFTGGGSVPSDLFIMALGFSAVAGHIWTPFLSFRGGKGVATSFGVLIALTPGVAFLLFLIFIAVVVWKRYISLGSLVASAVFPFAVYFMEPGRTELLILSVCLSIFVFIRHRENIKRLMAGTESKFGEKKVVFSTECSTGGNNLNGGSQGE